MIIALFFTTIATITTLLTILTKIYWLIPLWLLIGVLSGYFLVVFTLVLFYPFAKWSKVDNRFKHYYVRSMSTAINLLIFGIRVGEVINKEYIPKDTNFVIYPNHKKTYDGFIIASIIKRPMSFAAKKSLYKIPIFAGWLKYIGCLKIDRENDRKTLKEIIKGTKYLEQGLCITVFPEGTRTTDEALMMPSRAGAYRLATKVGLPILPVAIIGTSNPAKANRKSRKIKVVIGKPLYYEDYENLSTKEIGQYVVNTVNGLIEQYENN